MSKFRHKESGGVVDAVQFWPEQDWPEKVFEGIPGKTKEGEPPDRRYWLQVKDPRRATLELEEVRAEVHPIEPGDWVATNEVEALAVISQTDLAAEFDPA